MVNLDKVSYSYLPIIIFYFWNITLTFTGSAEIFELFYRDYMIIYHSEGKIT